MGFSILCPARTGLLISERSSSGLNIANTRRQDRTEKP